MFSKFFENEDGFFVGNMKEITKHFYLPNEASVQEPAIANGSNLLVPEGHISELLSLDEIGILKNQFATDMEEVAPDLRSNELAQHYADSLFHTLVNNGARTLEQLVMAGSQEFHHVGKYVLGPLAVSFVDAALKDSHGKAIFPARDATPFFYIAKALKTLDPTTYHLQIDDIQNPVFNRKLWGIEDEQDPENHVLSITNPLVQRLLSQMGFFASNQPKSFIEVGCWGSMVDQLNQAMQEGNIPIEEYSVYFLYTHLPNSIYGFMNIYGNNVPESALETIADTWEAFPKFFRRPTKLVEDGGVVKASLEGKLVESPFLQTWTLSALQGVVDAAIDFVVKKQIINPQDEILRLWELSNRAKSGEFTGILPGHTETWTEGEAWRENWKWGKIPPLK